VWKPIEKLQDSNIFRLMVVFKLFWERKRRNCVLATLMKIDERTKAGSRAGKPFRRKTLL
jgi:hypothetical protein